MGTLLAANLAFSIGFITRSDTTDTSKATRETVVDGWDNLVAAFVLLVSTSVVVLVIVHSSLDAIQRYHA